MLGSIGICTEVFEAWRQIKKLQQEVLLATRSGATTTSGMSLGASVDQVKATLSEYCVSLAQVTDHEGEVEALYNESLQYDPHNNNAILGLAKLFKHKSDLNGCIAQCRKVVTSNTSNDEAVIMLSESLSLLQQQQLQAQWDAEADGKETDESRDVGTVETSSIIEPLKSFLKEFPNNYKVLERLIVVLRRMGRLPEVPFHLTMAENTDKRSIAHSGYHYCKGLYARYTNDVISAIQHFNLSRKDIKSD